MNIRHWFVLGALGCVQLAAVAQQVPEPEQQRPQDADAAVPALTYTSAFDGFLAAGSDQDPAPDKAWRPANAQLANPEAGHAHHAPKDQAPVAPAPAQAAPPKHQHQHEGT